MPIGAKLPSDLWDVAGNVHPITSPASARVQPILAAQGGGQGIEVFGDEVPIPVAFEIRRLPRAMFG